MQNTSLQWGWMYSQVLIQPYTIMPLRIREMIIVLSIYQGIIVCKKILIMSNSLISDWILTKGASNGAISAFDVQSIQSLTNQCSFDGTEYCTCSISNFKQLAIYFCNKKFKINCLFSPFCVDIYWYVSIFICNVAQIYYHPVFVRRHGKTRYRRLGGPGRGDTR